MSVTSTKSSRQNDPYWRHRVTAMSWLMLTNSCLPILTLSPTGYRTSFCSTWRPCVYVFIQWPCWPLQSTCARRLGAERFGFLASPSPRMRQEWSDPIQQRRRWQPALYISYLLTAIAPGQWCVVHACRQHLNVLQYLVHFSARCKVIIYKLDIFSCIVARWLFRCSMILTCHLVKDLTPLVATEFICGKTFSFNETVIYTRSVMTFLGFFRQVHQQQDVYACVSVIIRFLCVRDFRIA